MLDSLSSSVQLKRGFTLVEILVTLFIILSIVGLISYLALYFSRNYSFSFEEQKSIAEAQQGVYTMIREIREARSGDDGSWALSETEDNNLVFYADVTNDGKPDKVRYFLDGEELRKGIIEPTQVPVTYPDANEVIRTIAYNVDNETHPLFTYYNGNWPGDSTTNPLSSFNRLLDTRYISVYLRININPETGAEPFELQSGVQIRSLKDNL